MKIHESTVWDCKLEELPCVKSPSGNITSLTPGSEIDFKIQRIYYLYDVPSGESRGGHAHRALHQLLIAAGGSFDVILFDGKEQRKVSLNRPFQGLRIVPGIWRELENFSSGATCLVLASLNYDPEDYIRDIDVFNKIKTNN